MEQSKTFIFLSLLFLLPQILAFSATAGNAEKPDVQGLLKDFIEDYLKNDILPETPIEFGIRINSPREEKWTIAIDKSSSDKVTLSEGFQEKPTFYLVTDYPVLKKIYDDEINALTAAGRARMNDAAPLDFGFMPGFRASPDFISGVVLPLGFHLFTRGKPEIIPFGERHSRFVHGGNTVVFYYEKGLRTGWYQLETGMKINESLEDTANPFPTLFVFTKGEGQAFLRNKKMVVKEGMCIFVPADMIHQFWTEGDTVLEFILIMFGEGA